LEKISSLLAVDHEKILSTSLVHKEESSCGVAGNAGQIRRSDAELRAPC
jgi:hypothetical protein